MNRRGNRISRRTLGFPLVRKVTGSPSRSRFARRESNIPRVRRREHYLGRDTIPQLQDAGPHPIAVAAATFLSSIYTYRFRYRVTSHPPPRTIFTIAAATFTPARRRRGKQANDLETAAARTHTAKLRADGEEPPKSEREDKSRLYRRSLITLALRREISFR